MCSRDESTGIVTRSNGMKKLFVGNLSPDTSEDDLRALFSQHGVVRAIKLVSDVFTGKCRGFGFIDMEGHHARAAIAALDGKSFKGNSIRVKEERPHEARGHGRARR
jgi:RNA recognition motif-containing protein